MFGYLKQSTASQSRTIGPFLDDTDFKTPETALSIANTDIKLLINGGVSANKNSGGGTHRAAGMYSITFDATDTATVGEMALVVSVAGALPVTAKFWVFEEAVYDALYAASAPGYGTAQTGDSFARLGAPVGASISADIATIDTEVGVIDGIVDDILVDTGTTLQAEVDAIQATTETINTKIGTPADVSLANDIGDITSGMLSELPQAILPVNPTLPEAIMALYMALRNRTTTTSGQISYTNDAGDVIFKATIADDGTTFTKSEVVAGP